jgi:predicted nucleic acid-binding Zn ribbon protein
VAFKSNQQPTKIGNIFNDFIVQHGLEDRVKETMLPGIWNEVVGKKIAAVTRINRFENGQLFIDTASSTWRAEIIMRRDKILKQMNEKFGEDFVKEIIIK